MKEINSLLNKHFSTLIDSGDEVVQRLFESAHIVALPAQQPVFLFGDTCKNYLLVLEGNVRIYLTTITGREVVLYHVHPGESCVLTTSCLLGGDDYPAAGITEEPTTALAINSTNFHQALAQSEVFRDFVFTNLGKRISEMIARIEQVTTRAIDKRLADFLLNAANKSSKIVITHQQLAAELGTAREVISRHLKHFEENGWVKLGRGSVEIINSTSLSKQV